MRARVSVSIAAVALVVVSTLVPVSGAARADTGAEADAGTTTSGESIPDHCGDRCAEILPPGQDGSATLTEILAHQLVGTRPPHSDDQLGTYAALADEYPTVTTDTIDRFFNDASFGVEPDEVAGRIRPRDDVTIVRDSDHVPHVYGDTREGTEFGAGYVAAQDRLWIMDVLRRVGRGQLTSFAGGAEANRQLEQQFFAAAPYTESELRAQIDRLARSGPRGRQGLADARAYLDGINTYIERAKRGRYFPGEYVLTGHVTPITNLGEIEPFTLTDLAVLASVIGAQFGVGGGGEVRAAIARLALHERYGPEQGERVWRGMRAENDPETVRTLHDGQTFPYGGTPDEPEGRALPEPGSVTGQPLVFDREGSAADADAEPQRVSAPSRLDPARGIFADGVLPSDLLSGETGMSNALMVSGRHTDNGNPVAVFGPQTGYFAPQLLMLQELQGPGISARGASFAGLSFYVLLGRGQDYSWSATSAGQDVLDTYAVELCEPDGTTPTRESDHYRFRGECVPMETVERENAWQPTIADPTPPGSYTLRSYRTEFGPVTHRAVVDGAPVAYTTLRSSFLHEVDSLIGFQKFNDPDAIRSAEDFQRAAADINFTFNWFYADADDTAYYNSGANPQRPDVVDPSMPIRAEPRFEWENWDPETNTATYTPFEAHPHSVNQDYYISWNNAQAQEYAAAGSGWSAVHRGDLLDRRVADLIADGGTANRAELVREMAEAGLADLRAERVLPLLLRVLDTAPVTDPDAQAALARLRAWLDDGGLRTETEPGSRTYAHAEASRIMDAWWPLLVRAQFEPGLGPEAFGAMVEVLQINDSPSGFQNEVPGKRVGQAHQGSTFHSGWWGYVHKDLRAVLGEPVAGPLGETFCGGGDLDRCRDLLLDTLRQAAAQPATEVYPGDANCDAGDQWCADSIVHNPLGGITHDKISWQNRPTYQQVVEFPTRRE
ncbi:penicillin acylase family protein [Saccharomonospora halophila]|uniref:penicillin acylase family protein n=1 Tax=Saccharomonospora halophila TaxID=129922 RepID=UPI00037D46BB|nr:penicillin acylase family protein [Saccharomonospora halophila]